MPLPTVINYDLALSDKGTGYTRYTTIKAWIAAMLVAHPNLVSEDIILRLNIYNDWPAGLDETFVDFGSTAVTDATRYFLLDVVASERHDGTPGSGFHFASTTGGYTFYSRSQFVIFDGFEASAPTGDQTMFGGAANTIVRNSLLHDIISGGFCSDAGAIFEDTTVYNTAPSSGSAVGAAFQNVTLKNVTVHSKPTSGGWNGDIVLHTCDCNEVYVYHSHTKVSLDAFHNCTGDYNVGLAIGGTIPGGNSFNITDDSDLVNPSLNDYRIKNTSPLKTAGLAGAPIGGFYEPDVGGGETLAIDSGSYSLTGADVGLVVNRNISINAGSYSLLGYDAGLLAGRNITASDGSYSLSGSGVNLKADRCIIIDAGSYELIGSDVALTYAPTANETLIVEVGSYSLIGSDAGLLVDYKITIETGIYELTGSSAQLYYNSKITTESGSYALTGAEVGLTVGYGIIATSGNYDLLGSGVILKYSGDAINNIGIFSARFAVSNINLTSKENMMASEYKQSSIIVTLRA